MFICNNFDRWKRGYLEIRQSNHNEPLEWVHCTDAQSFTVISYAVQKLLMQVVDDLFRFFTLVYLFVYCFFFCQES